MLVKVSRSSEQRNIPVLAPLAACLAFLMGSSRGHCAVAYTSRDLREDKRMFNEFVRHSDRVK